MEITDFYRQVFKTLNVKMDWEPDINRDGLVKFRYEESCPDEQFINFTAYDEEFGVEKYFQIILKCLKAMC